MTQYSMFADYRAVLVAIRCMAKERKDAAKQARLYWPQDYVRPGYAARMDARVAELDGAAEQLINLLPEGEQVKARKEYSK